MANTVQLKRSGVPGKSPTTAQLQLGELAINTYDGLLYLKKNVSGVETIVAVGSNVGGQRYLPVLLADGITTTDALQMPVVDNLRTTINSFLFPVLMRDGTTQTWVPFY